MQKIFTLLFTFLILMSYQAQGQLESGSTVPNFTGTDLDGNEWTLYDILDEGKVVVLDISATWCGPCWDYHESGVLEELYTEYGPEGTDELMVFMIEGDGSTNTDCLYGPDGCNGITLGNWVEGTDYPIIDDGSLSETLAINYFPTLYYVCPGGIITEFNQIGTEELYDLVQSCPEEAGVNNVFLYDYSGAEELFCQSETFVPTAKIQNLGSEILTAVNINLTINGTLTETIEWTGSLGTYAVEEITFAEITIDEDTNIEMSASTPNGATDDSPTDNTLSAESSVGAESDGNNLTVEVLTDGYGAETYWEIVDENENLLFSGGSRIDPLGPDGYLDDTLYVTPLAVPKDGCYEFRIYDIFGDGICCFEGDGYFRLLDPAGGVIFEGGEFEAFTSAPFSVINSVEVVNKAIVVSASDHPADFCKSYSFDRIITIQNQGANDITNVGIDITRGGNVQNFIWTGTVTSGNYASITLDEITLDESEDITYEMVSINGGANNSLEENVVSNGFTRRYTDQNTVTMELQLTDYAYEAYWQFTDENGNILASGGNELVGEAGGAVAVTPDDPGVYADDVLITEEIILPSDAASGCYEFLLVDAYRDGFTPIFSLNEATFKLTDATGTVIYDENISTLIFEAQPYPVEMDLLTSTNELTAVGELSVYPNPVSDQLLINFSTSENTPLEIGVYDVLGRQVATLGQSNFAIGTHKEELNVSGLANGVYFVRLANAQGQSNRKFVVSH